MKTESNTPAPVLTEREKFFSVTGPCPHPYCILPVEHNFNETDHIQL